VRCKPLIYWFSSLLSGFFCGVAYGKVRAFKINIPIWGNF